MCAIFQRKIMNKQKIKNKNKNKNKAIEIEKPNDTF